MSYELKMQGVGNGKRSRLYKKTKRASMNKIDATHLPNAVTVWKSSTYKNWSINDYYYYVVKISDIEAYKKEKYKL